MSAEIYLNLLNYWNDENIQPVEAFGYQVALAEILGLRNKISIPETKNIKRNTKNASLFSENASLLDKELFEASNHSLRNIGKFFGVVENLSYREILEHAAGNLKVKKMKSTKEEDLENKIVSEFLNQVWNNLNRDKQEELRQKLFERIHSEDEELAKKILNVASPFSELTGASSARFGTYIAATTALSLVGGALGLTLGFGAYVATTRALAIALGPIGWILTGVWAFYEFGSPSYSKKIIPSIILLYTMKLELAKFSSDLE